MLAQSFESEFYQWLCSKPANETYPYFNGNCCCFAQFLFETGRSNGVVPMVTETTYAVVGDIEFTPIPKTIRKAVTPSLFRRTFREGYDTFGKARRRFEKAYKKAHGVKPTSFGSPAPIKLKLKTKSVDGHYIIINELVDA